MQNRIGILEVDFTTWFQILRIICKIDLNETSDNGNHGNICYSFLNKISYIINKFSVLLYLLRIQIETVLYDIKVIYEMSVQTNEIKFQKFKHPNVFVFHPNSLW